MRPNSNHVQAALLRAITDEAGLSLPNRQKPILVVEAMESRDWASATFLGTCHRFDIRIDGEAAAVTAAVAALRAGIGEREIAIAGHIVAEIAVVSESGCRIDDSMVTNLLTVNALTIID